MDFIQWDNQILGGIIAYRVCCRDGIYDKQCLVDIDWLCGGIVIAAGLHQWEHQASAYK